MKSLNSLILGASAILASAVVAYGEIKFTIDHNENGSATSSFKFKNVPPPSKDDAATRAKFMIADGERDENGGELEKLHDGKVPTEEDQPGENFFFTAGTDGGRLVVDLGGVIEVSQVNTYSWHANTRGPQLYKLYVSEGTADGFKNQPRKGTDPEKCGWKLITKVDTRPKQGEVGGQYGVSIFDSDGAMGKYRYLLFDISQTEEDDAFGNTFYSEIDVIGKGDSATATTATASSPSEPPFVAHSTDGYCTISIDTSRAPGLKDWANHQLAPVLAEWYPKIVAMLPSEGYAAPTNFSVTIRPGNRGEVAATGGRGVTANSDWLMNSRKEINREAIGALLHEEVHVIQQYGGGRRRGITNAPAANSDAPRTRPPGWLVEGIPDYIRWFKYEPQSHGADAVWMKNRRNLTLNYDGMYRISACFLNYVAEKYDKDLVTKLNAACRQGTYNADLWKTATGKTVEELNDEWKAATEKEIATLRAETSSGTQSVEAASAKINALTDAEKAAGWKLLFNGQDLTGWHNFKRDGVRPGWQVRDGALVCADPHDAGDIVTTDQYDWFELQLDYNISVAGNSGIMYHVTDEGRAAWETGPEFQLEDNKEAADKIRCGWLYQLYQPPDDPNTGKPLDATKPVGEWNHVRLLISPQKCEHEINGVKYFEYVLGSEDFTNRVAKSKFARMPKFAKSMTGYITLQGDHGSVSFRNIKVKPIEAK